jgi:hypothetical protein
MGLFDFLTSTRAPAAGTPALPADDVRAAVLGLNRPTAPFRIVDGASEDVDLIAEWRIVDREWHGVFDRAGVRKVFRIFMKLDATNHEVRAVDREYSVEWRAGVATLSLAASAFRGQKQSVEFGAGYAFTETGAGGETYRYSFSTKELKRPIQDAVTGCGWTYRGVVFAKL